jgi:hypothetical protein
VEDVVFQLLNPATCDEYFQAFGGLTVDQCSTNNAEVDQSGWLDSLRIAIAAASAGANFRTRIKARRSRVNSRWRDALVKLTEAVEQLLRAQGEVSVVGSSSVRWLRSMSSISLRSVYSNVASGCAGSQLIISAQLALTLQTGAGV